ncbi:hypothetical protein [Saccharopolyspora oryzae]|uniref:Plastocyanin n=1 Tax=Saccharopolyspora oryzae TaxID=2997343 RepID=A0ABT4V7Y6_9PSEU|nr:hypothetical protein [Saccharopolyspora oryzae]MDA3630081.1 hypothetical protein [Saccharopolyspora oryzae]
MHAGKNANRFSTRRRGFGVLLGVIALLAALCAGATTASAAQPAQTGFGPPQVVPVRMVDFGFDQPAWFPPGRYTFHAINAGRAVHILEINGPGVDNAKTPVVRPGDAADLTVTLAPGVYDFWCPVGNHRQLGMQLYVRVG